MQTLFGEPSAIQFGSKNQEMNSNLFAFQKFSAEPYNSANFQESSRIYRMIMGEKSAKEEDPKLKSNVFQSKNSAFTSPSMLLNF
jgi:hypothetical protein